LGKKINRKKDYSMVEIQKDIVLATNDSTKYLMLQTKYLVQDYFTFMVSIKSGDFSGKSSFCISISDLKDSVSKLEKCYKTLDGKVVLYDNDSDSFLSFDFENSGKVIVIGQIGGTHSDQFVRFSFSSDQTVVPILINEIREIFIFEDK
jgi:hypothetical protein